MDTQCPNCRSTNILAMLTGFHCPDCGENFNTGGGFRFFNW